MTFPFRRRSDHFSTPHERARRRAAERLDGPIGFAENEWLERHLAECGACRAVAEDYLANQGELRALARQPIEAPRDLWARTAAAIEREASASAPARPAPGSRRRPSPVPLGALAGLMVLAVVFGATLLSGRTTPSVTPFASDNVAVLPSPSLPSPSERPAPTPWVIAPDGVDWVAKVDDGTLAYYSTEVDRVCDGGAVCPPLDSTPRPLDVPDAPKEAIISDDENTLAVVNESSGGGNSIVVVPVPTPDGGTGGPTDPPSASPPPTLTPVPTPSPAGSPSVAPVSEPPVTEPPVTAPPGSEPPVTPDPTGPIEIADNVIVVGETAFSADGSRFAFSARTADGSAGPDIYLWTAGEQTATRITTDGRSVFAGWVNGLVVGSRAVAASSPDASASPAPSVFPEPDASAAPVVGRPETFAIDPATGEQIAVEGTMWRPAVDPTGTYAVYWDGTLELDAATGEYRPGEGRLVVGAWPGLPEAPTGGDPDASAPPVGSPSPSVALPAVPSPTPGLVGDGDVAVLFEGSVLEWEARWDETGQHVALWIADPEDPEIGRLSLYETDADGALAVDEPALRGEFARPGFAISEGSLAWATREGQDGKGSHVKVVAWTDDGIGKVETKPGEDVLVVQH